MAPDQPAARSHRLTFGRNKNLASTDACKVPTAHLHGDGRRVSLVYRGLGAFTFQLKNATRLTNSSAWAGRANGRFFSCQLRFSPKGERVHGSGSDDLGSTVTVDVRMQPQAQTIWHGHFETGGLAQDVTIACLTFND